MGKIFYSDFYNEEDWKILQSDGIWDTDIADLVPYLMGQAFDNPLLIIQPNHILLIPVKDYKSTTPLHIASADNHYQAIRIPDHHTKIWEQLSNKMHEKDWMIIDRNTVQNLLSERNQNKLQDSKLQTSPPMSPHSNNRGTDILSTSANLTETKQTSKDN